MPAMGPDLDYAKSQGDKVFNILKDILALRGIGWVFLVEIKEFPYLKNWKEEHFEILERLQKDLQRIFEIDACASF